MARSTVDVFGLRSVHIPSMVHLQYDDLASRLVDAVQDTKRSASRAAYAREFVAEFSADSLRVVQKRPSDEVDHGCGHAFRQSLANRPCGRSCDNEVVAARRQRCLGGRSPRTASTPRTTSPAVTADSAARRARTASVSLSTEIVSSRLARSSVLMRTIAGRPLRVTTTGRYRSRSFRPRPFARRSRPTLC